ncbi:MAG: hypothetical protein R3185_07125 [Candidatus Thermoplasmatota archaeon]|nr:hypothetical protein [Candidatus Thermoplasmatota archaeon]
MQPSSTAVLTSSMALLLLLAGLALPVSAQVQENTIELSAAVESTPETLPGTYVANVTITATNQGGACTCSQTTVTLTGEDVGNLTEVTFEPPSVTFDWVAQGEQGNAGGASKSVNLTFTAPESLYGASDHTLTLNATAETDSPTATYTVTPTQLTVSFPDAPQSQEAESPDGTDDEASSNETAPNEPEAPADNGTMTGDGGDDEEESNDSPAAGVLVLLASLGLALVVRRRR